MLNKISSTYLEAYHQISPEPEMEHILMLHTSDIPSYGSPDLNVKIPEKTTEQKCTGHGSQPTL